MANMSADNLKNNLSDLAKTYLWEVIIVNPVGGGDAETLELRCQSAVIPGRSVGEILVPFKATAGIKYPGKLTMSHAFPVTFVEGLDKKVFDALHAWNQAIVNDRLGTGGPDSTIKTNIHLRLLNPQGTVFAKIKLVGCYVQAIDDVPLAYEAEGNVVYNVTFSYDYWEEQS